MKAKRIYLKDIKGLPTMKRKGVKTRVGVARQHVYKVTIGVDTYFKVQLHRGGESKIKYFKLKREAKVFVRKLNREKVWNESQD